MNNSFIVSSADVGKRKYNGFIFKLRPIQPAFNAAMRKYSKSVTSGAGPGIKEEGLKESRNSTTSSRDIFVVHGHNDGIKQTVARFLEQLKLKPIILHEQPNGGRTLIEKFEDHAKVRFAVVIMTDDDEGKQKDGEHLLPRARQNVILEQGYFLGALGRKNVCTLYMKGVEIPSDLFGVLYVPFDEGDAWKYQLAKEIKVSGIEVDMNLIT